MSNSCRLSFVFLVVSLTVSGCIKKKPVEKSVEMKKDIIVRETEAVPLFDGSTFNGWEGNMDIFRIEDGAIVAGSLDQRIPQNEFLCTTKEYSNFELKLTAKLVGRGDNAGVQLRSRRIPGHHEVIGYQADMGETDPRYGIIWGALYDEARRNRLLAGAKNQEELAKVFKSGDWNEMVIRCVGKRIQIWVNGYQTIDYTETDNSIELTGIIGLQIHGGRPQKVWYKDITIREIIM